MIDLLHVYINFQQWFLYITCNTKVRLELELTNQTCFWLLSNNPTILSLCSSSQCTKERKHSLLERMKITKPLEGGKMSSTYCWKFLAKFVATGCKLVITTLNGGFWKLFSLCWGHWHNKCIPEDDYLGVSVPN